ncbi:single-stranded-DNA-specific exonuclease RecJ [Gynuella sp.]|uniref:single-stranded-DNA-specific exonuclease RecJ n=1 Tax=Gynuella sp. TaxID=2969146 RepID=UPI003D0970E8
MTTTEKKIVRRTPLAELSDWDPAEPNILRTIYQNRGIATLQQLEKGTQQLLSYRQMKGIEEAAALMVRHIQSQSNIVVVGDFDADGATSTALSVLVLKALGASNVRYLVPNRFEFGYGLSPEIVQVAHSMNPDLIMTVDNGISSIEGVAVARRLGVDVLVTDHHLQGAELPDANAIVNPNQHDCPFPSKATCGCGVAFYLLAAVKAGLKQAGWFEEQGLREPNLADYLDIVALATVADVVPLDQNNRIFVHQGLARIRAGKARPGILALLEVAGRNYQQVVAADMGFAVGPRLNAAGRLDDMSLGIECLLAEDPYRARELAVLLNDMNIDRRAIEQSMQKEALGFLAKFEADTDAEGLPWGVCLYQPDWHEGVIGILASRIKDRVHRPTIAFAQAEDGNLKGSARSIPGFHIRDGLDAVAKRYPEVLAKFGGHAMAAGMTVRAEHFERFQQAFDEEVRRQLESDQLVAQVASDGELGVSDFNLELADLLRNAGPWGQAFPEPCFDGYFNIVQQRIVGQKHLKLTLSPQGSDLLIDAIAFNVDLNIWPTQAPKIQCAYKLDINEFRGNISLQLMLEYIQPVFP